MSSICATLEFMGKMLTLNTMLSADFDDVGEMDVVGDELAELNQLACQPLILTGYHRGNSYYTNGSLISNDLYPQAWYFPDGQLSMATGPGYNDLLPERPGNGLSLGAR